MAKIEDDVARLRHELEAVAADHQELARVGAELATREADLVAVEERWLERTAELEEIDSQP